MSGIFKDIASPSLWERLGLDEEGFEGFGALDEDDLPIRTLFAGAEEEAAYGADAEAPPAPVEVPSRSRVLMARRVRQGSAPNSYQAGYVQAFRDLLAHMGTHDPEANRRLLSAWHETLDVNGTVAPREVELARAQFGALDPARLPLPSSMAQVEADAEELPPVYVADTMGAEEAILAHGVPESYGEFSIEDRLGDAALAGFVSGQRRVGSRRAAEHTLRHSSEKNQSTPVSQGAVFVEDVEAEPRLYSDGHVRDAVYGALRAVPCPSCSSIPLDQVQAGAAHDCGVCDGHGALLVPSADASSWFGVRYGSLLPILLGIGVEVIDEFAPMSAEPSGKDKTGRPRRPRRPPTAYHWSEEALSAPSSGLTEGPESVSGLRAIAPTHWVQRHTRPLP